MSKYFLQKSSYVLLRESHPRPNLVEVNDKLHLEYGERELKLFKKKALLGIKSVSRGGSNRSVSMVEVEFFPHGFLTLVSVYIVCVYLS
jgi:hypothetical protein